MAPTALELQNPPAAKTTAKTASAGKNSGKHSAVAETSPTTENTAIPSRAEIEQYAEEWLLHCELERHSPRTTETRRVFFKCLLWFLDHRGYQECGTRELRQFFHYLAHGHEEPGGRWGIPNPRFTRPLRPITIKDYHVCIRQFFDWMVREEILSVSPMARMAQPMVREEVKQPLSKAQVEALLRAAKRSQNPRRDEALVLILLDSGVRASELISLRVQDIDLRNGSFEVIGKGNKKRTCYLGKATVKALMAYLRQPKLPPESPLFPCMRNGVLSRDPLTRSGLLQLITRLGQDAGVPTNPHQLRRTFATSMLEAGANIISVRDMLGHTNIQMTLKYLAVSQSHIEAQHRQFSPADRLKMR